MPNKNPQTGEEMINPGVFLANLEPGEHMIEVKYLDRTGKTNGPYPLKFDTRAEQLKNGKDAINRTSPLINFSRSSDGELTGSFIRILFHGPIIKEIRYSVNSDKLDQVFPLEATTRAQEVRGKLNMTFPKDTQFVSVQATFIDGTKTALQKCVPEPGD